MSAVDPCSRCNEAHAPDASPDANGWCARCRARVVRTATRAALLPGLLMAAGYLWLLSWADLLGHRLVVVWLALGAVLAWVTFKVARRAAFDVVRARAGRVQGR